MTAQPENYTVSILRDEEDFRLLQQEWEALFARSPNTHFFHDFSWKWRSWTCVAARAGQRLRIVTGRTESKLVLILPLIIKNRVARFLNSETFEYRDLLIDDDKLDDRWLVATWRAVIDLGECDILLLQNVRSPSNIELLLRANKVGGWLYHDTSPAIRLHNYQLWDDYAAGRPKKLIADQRRQWRRLHLAAPALRCEMVQDSGDVQRVLAWIIEQKEVWAREKGLPHMVWRGDRGDLLAQAVQDALGADRLMAIRLREGEQTISAGMGFILDGRFTFEIFAFDRAWENFSPSRLLQERMIRWCMQNGIEEFDFMPRGGSPYKHLWADNYIPSTSYVIATSARGSLSILWQRYLAIMLQQSGLFRGLYQQFPAGLRRPIRNLLSQGLPADLIRKMSRKG